MIIDVENLSKKFEDLTAVDKLSFTVDEGEVFGLLGPNGAGKTTALHMLATLLKPSSGTASINGYDIVKQPSLVRKSIGVVFQEPSSDELLTGYENLRLHALMYGVPSSDRDKRIEDALRLVDLTDRKDDLMKKYSGGMRRRLELARGLLHKPKVLFLDEPTLGLDPQSREHIWLYVGRLAKEEKVTVIITTHYMEEADRLCSRVAIIDHGRIAVLDSPANLKRVIGGDMVWLKTREANIEAVKKFEYVKKVDESDDAVLLIVKDVGEHLQEILSMIGKVESVEVRSATLNDVFLRYTGRELHEGEHPEGGFWEKMATYRSRR